MMTVAVLNTKEIYWNFLKKVQSPRVQNHKRSVFRIQNCEFGGHTVGGVGE